ncbi:hypothetical protein BD626DRAFT_632798 [Schizophyllum amplum]|uniref:Uncharacterized protein n=1 Tax=Schizophyllum amplum TaxID=97359 RepID=A0A550C5E7_9AGAR|nr:hypothetical protein BD626DRAFT_632798 [Auriculariopsis ampla]
MATPAVDLPVKAQPGSSSMSANRREAALQRYAQRYHLYDGRLLLRKTPALIEEIKKHPSRHNQRNPDKEKVYLKDRKGLLGESEDNLLFYMFLHFYLIDLRAQRVVARSVAGTFWRWSEFSRDDIPIHDMPSMTADLKVANIPREIDKHLQYREHWARQPIYEMGSSASDQALNAMRQKVLDNIKDLTPREYEGTALVWPADKV